MTALRRLAIAATIGMFLVVAMGSTVTNTGSGEGCGDSWPLCNGEFVPVPDRATLIELSHRLVTGVEGFLIASFAWLAWRARGRYPEVRLFVPLMVLTLLLQAGMGAWAVKYTQSSPVLALHFGISLICFASTFITMRIVLGSPQSPSQTVAAPAPAYRSLAWAALIGSVLVAYLGAYMRHSGAELGCHTWPLCNGAVVPDLSGASGVAFGHRLAALGCTFIVGALAWSAVRARERRGDLAAISVAAFGLILAQAGIGGAVVLSRLTLSTTLAHALVMALLFAALSDCCWRSWPRVAGTAAAAAVPVPRAAAAD